MTMGMVMAMLRKARVKNELATARNRPAKSETK
jgi:hypothetical protein